MPESVNHRTTILMKEVFEFIFNVHRCYKCGTFYAIESAKDSASAACPFCAKDTIRDLTSNNDALERRITALKGVIARKSK